MHHVITGGGGFLGAHLIAAIQRNGDYRKVIVVDPKPRHQDLDFIEFNSDLVSYELGSFRDPKVLEKVLPEAATVYHLCAIGHTGIYGGKRYVDYVYDFNVRGTMELIEKCKEFGVKRFIYSSSVAVNFVGEPFYNLQEIAAYPDPAKYIDSYSFTKAQAEKFVISQSSPTFKTTCLRFRAIYGPKDVTVVEKVVNVVEAGWFIGKISCHGREAISNMSAGENCGEAMVLADKALQDDTKKHGQVYFIHDGNVIGQYSVWTPLIRALGRTPPSLSIPYQLVKHATSVVAWFCYEVIKRPPPMSPFELAILANDNTYSIEKAIKELGFSPNQNYFAKAVEYYRNQRMQREVELQPSLRRTDLFHNLSVALALALLYFSVSNFVMYISK